jgi:AGCS family alanine or glycine:cation symporter
LALIIEDGFSGRAVLGGSLGAIIMAGVRRAVFSNEAGLGSAGMAHATVKTDYPIREGVVASLGPFIDTVVVSTATAMVILLGGRYGVDAAKSAAQLDTEVGSHIEYALGAGDLKGIDGVRVEHRLRSGGFEVALMDERGEPLVGGIVRAQDDPEPDLQGCRFAAASGFERRCTLSLTPLAEADAHAGEGLTLRVKALDADSSFEITKLELVSSVKGIALTAEAFDEDLPGFGTWFIPIAGFLFAFSTMVTWSFYGETATAYLVGEAGVTPYRVLFVGLAYLGATQDLGLVISFSDAMVGLLVIPNMLALLLLSGRVREWSREYFEALRRGDFDR